jgi:DNA phosphorothioation-associated putative methyltransferase
LQAQSFDRYVVEERLPFASVAGQPGPPQFWLTTMDFQTYKKLVNSILVGKQLPDAIYVHQTTLDAVPLELAAHLARAVAALGVDTQEWNIVKFFKRDHKVALLNYPRFFEDAYPALDHAYTIDLERGTFRESDYRNSDNPPILHRKETFLKPDHPSVPLFRAITEEGEQFGLYENPRSIGFKKSWDRLISRRGYVLNEQGRLKPKPSKVSAAVHLPESGKVRVERHLTAIDRDKLSAPMQALARHNYLNGDFSVFDYGCGKGDDVRELQAHVVDVLFWDPVYCPNGAKKRADIVNLGYVINVIEERKERDQVLRDAFKHTAKLLAVSAMVAGDATISQFTQHKDGVLTKRNTFQKYYTQSELRSYIETTLDTNAIAVSPGIFFVFKDELEEQTFLSERQHIRREWAQLTLRERVSSTVSVDAETILERNRQLFDDFWRICLDFGRIPANTEFEFSDRVRAIAGSHIKAFRILSEHNGRAIFERAQEARRGDLLVYFTLGLFGKRKPYSHMPTSLQRDLKAWFGSYKDAIREATDLLFSVGKTKNIAEACEAVHPTLGCGVLEDGHSLTIHRSLVNELPPILRVYVGCATQLYGDIEGVDLIKIHMTSGKVSLMKYDNFEGKPVPEMLQRVKINLRDQEIDVFNYSGLYVPHPLYFKSKLIRKDFRNYAAQVDFDKKLANLGCLDFSGFGPPRDELYTALSHLGLTIDGFDLQTLSPQAARSS